MKRLLEVCLVAAILATNLPPACAQSPALQKGVSVQMAATSNATPMPAADNDDAWIVTIGADGKLYFGADPVDADGLTNDMKIHPRKRDAKLYIKADARAPFSSVEKVMQIGRKAVFRIGGPPDKPERNTGVRKNGGAPRPGSASYLGALRCCGCGIKQFREALGED